MRFTSHLETWQCKRLHKTASRSHFSKNSSTMAHPAKTGLYKPFQNNQKDPPTFCKDLHTATTASLLLFTPKHPQNTGNVAISINIAFVTKKSAQRHPHLSTPQKTSFPTSPNPRLCRCTAARKRPAMAPSDRLSKSIQPLFEP